MILSKTGIGYAAKHLLKVAFPNFQPEIKVENGIAQADFKDWKIIFGNEPLHTDSFSYLIDNKSIIIKEDIISILFDLLSRREELRQTAQFDRHGRYCYEGSLAQRFHCDQRPIIDDWAMKIRKIAVEMMPELQILPRKSHDYSTHDIDLLCRFGGFFKNLRTLSADLLNPRYKGQFRKSWMQFRDYQKDKDNDPMTKAARMLAEADQEAGWESIFFIKALVSGENDCTYDIFGEQIQRLIAELTKIDAEIGLHGSYTSLEDSCIFNKEKERLEHVLGQKIVLNRQHYLRFEAEKTPGIWAQADIGHDYTLGYAEQYGFRCGTCHPFPIYDLKNDCPTNIIEHPLIAMDGTFFQYLKLNEAESREIINNLRKICHEVEGDFVLLWHNSSVFREYENWYKEVFTACL